MGDVTIEGGPQDEHGVSILNTSGGGVRRGVLVKAEIRTGNPSIVHGPTCSNGTSQRRRLLHGNGAGCGADHASEARRRGGHPKLGIKGRPPRPRQRVQGRGNWRPCFQGPGTANPAPGILGVDMSMEKTAAVGALNR